MGLGKILIAGLVISAGIGVNARAKDAGDAGYTVMLDTISRIRIVSENCGLVFNPAYDVDFLTALTEKQIDISTTTNQLIDYYKVEKRRMGSDCPDDATSRLKTLDSIYHHALKSIRGS